MTLKELIKQEEFVIKRIYELKKKLINAEERESNQECKLWMDTDFKSKKLTNGDQRKAYVKSEMSNYVSTSGLYKNQITLCENVLKLIRFKQRAILEKACPEDENEYDYYNDFLNNLLDSIE